jgi:acyl carrier protein
LLQSAAADPDCAIERLAMLAPGEIARPAPHRTGHRPAAIEPVQPSRVDDAARAAMETLVTAVVRELLNVDRIGLSDNFFDLGAKSLMLIRAHASLQDRLGRKFPLVALYQHTSIGALAVFLAGQSEAGVDTMTKEADARAARRRAARARSPERGDRG